ncbi:hypothetical protein ABEB36_006796 [Hypothenemus hampei]|uniref:GH18 domain-containing protein n=1 Tax=Hypothenemus hampei TaxID=57062 RepID=A0ABD1ERR5_HYPHA
MFIEDNHYILLHRHPSNLWHVDKKTMLMVACLILPVSVFCATYMMLFGIYEKLVYPKMLGGPFNSMENLIKSQERAIAYAKIYPAKNYSYIPRNLDSLQSKINDFKLVCYFNLPADKNSMQISDIDPNLCTHINVAFAAVVNHSIYLDDTNLGYLEEIVKLKEPNKNLKILLSIGGNGNNNGFPEMVKNHTNRKTFIKSVFNYVNLYHIDGIDLDWEFPGEYINYDHNQRMHFTQLLFELRRAISKEPKSAILLTVAVAAATEIIEVSYDVSYMNQYVDYVNLMSYDYHYYTGVTPFTGFNSPLYETSSEKYYLATLNINYSSHYWNFLGMDKRKIVVGLPTYGHSFRLLNPRNHDLYAPASGYGKLGNFGFASYPIICDFLQTNHITPIFDMESYSPYASKYYEWITFDDPQSMSYKAEFIQANNFGGAMIYSLDADDFRGNCQLGLGENKKFPLIRTVKSVFEAN